MTYYHEKKELAQKAADELAKDERVASTRVSFQPYNGWLVVVRPKFLDCSDLADRAEIADGITRKAPGRKPVPPVDKPSRQRGEITADGGALPPEAPKSGATARVWQIASSMPGADRKAVIDACVAQGINAATASTQYGKWKKANFASA